MSGSTRICYSNPRGGFHANYGPGCFYRVVWYWSSGGTQDEPDHYQQAWAFPQASCPSGGSWTYDSALGICKRSRTRTRDCTSCYGNPVSPGLGQKHQLESDAEITPTFALQREYSSFNIDQLRGSFGIGWFLVPFDRRLITTTNASQAVTGVQAVRSGAERLYFTPSNGQWSAPSAPHLQLRQEAEGWSLTDTHQSTHERYDVGGRLLSIQRADGPPTTLSYSAPETPPDIAPSAGLLMTVSDGFGRTLSLKRDEEGRVRSITDPAGKEYSYSYHPDTKSLAAVSYPDGSSKRYVYDAAKGPARAFPTEESAWAVTSGTRLSQQQFERLGWKLPPVQEVVRGKLGDYDAYPLTGIIDERNVEYASYTYDLTGRATSTQHGVSAQKYGFTYGAPSSGQNQVTIEEPTGLKRVSTITSIRGTARETNLSQPAVASTPASNQVKTYDANGNVATLKDYRGNTTAFTYDLARNLEIKRVDGQGTSAQRTTSTQWHPLWKLPTQVAEPLKLTTFVYNGQSDGTNTVSCAPASARVGAQPLAVLCKKTEQATSDATGGQGFAAPLMGAPRTWSYSYSEAGQVLTADGPRTDVDDTTTYTYDSAGNLRSVANALGHTTTLSNYDAQGHVGRIVDPNGLATELTYSPRGWLTLRKSGDETTRYDYDSAGQLVKVTLPDASVVTYSHDDAHRLIGMADSQGNRVDFTLDNMGNVLKEEVKDSEGVLTRQVTRVYDALNRLQQVTGARQ